MTTEYLNVLYIGSAETGARLSQETEARGWYIYSAVSVFEALGAYAIYMPDAVIIDDVLDGDVAREAFYHLHSVKARPIFVITNRPDTWEQPLDSVFYVLPGDVGATALIEALLDLTVDRVA